MSDSSSIIAENVVFNSNECFKKLCNDSKLTISEYATIQFGEGWKSLLQCLVQEIKNHSVKINGISDTYILLDISFDVLIKAKEVYVWRAVNIAREESKTTCAKCGGFKRANESEIGPCLYCKDCLSKNITKHKTGTWLDKY